jgi:flagellar hook-associated protein 1 FlgK
MGSLFGTLNSSLDAIEAFQTALNVSQNNVSNASTPGYARQVVNLEALPFDISSGAIGGVEVGSTQSTQDEYVNQAVNNQVSQQGNFSAQYSALSSIQGLFDVSGQSGIVGALNNLFQSFSAWSANPGTTSAQQGVLTAAQELAQGFQSTAASLSQTTEQLNQQISSTVQQINQLGSQIQAENVAIIQNPDPSGGVNAGLDAQLHASIQSLSQLANVSVSYAPNGTATVLLGGQAPLVIGDQVDAIQTNFSGTGGGTYPGGIPNVQILDASGNDVTGQLSQGTLGGLLNVRNVVLPGLQGNTGQVGALNQLAQQVADRVNQTLASATTPAGLAGGPLFDYDATSPTDVASTLTVDPNITPSTLAPATVGPPPTSNGAALTLANLGQSTAPGDEINGQTMLQFLGSMAAQVGQQASDAQTGQNLAAQSLAQAQAVQTQISGVSLDSEAINVMELQKGYQAAGQMVSVINSLAETLLNMIPQTAG